MTSDVFPLYSLKHQHLLGTPAGCDIHSGSIFPLQTVLEHGGGFAGINRKVQLKPTQWSETDPKLPTEALLILKHGGVLTHAGRQQVS